MKTLRAVLVLAAIGLTTCSHPDRGGPLLGPSELSFGDELPQRDVYLLPVSSGIETRRASIITDYTGLRAAWDALFANYAPGQKPMLPYVDFENDVVLLASAGSTPTQLLSFRITRVRALTEHLEVLVESEWPCGGLPVMTTPAHVVAVPRMATQAAFEFVDNTQACP